MKNVLFALALSFTAGISAQVYKTSTGKVSFVSKTNSENISGTNSAVSAAVDSKTGKVEFSMLINSFQFSKDLMKKHFQETYMESTKYPKSTFSGTITDNSKVDYTKDGTYNVTVKGKLTIHGVTKEITTPGKVVVKGNKATLMADFKVKPKDYGIKIPADKVASIANEINISVNCECTKK